MENLVRYDGEKGQYQFKVEVQITKKQQNTESQMWKIIFVPIWSENLHYINNLVGSDTFKIFYRFIQIYVPYPNCLNWEKAYEQIKHFDIVYFRYIS